MPNESLLSLRPVLEYLTQPVLLVENGVILYCNSAAAVLEIAPGSSVFEFLGTTADFYREFDGVGTLSLTFTHGSLELDASIHRHAGIDLFAITALPPEASSLGTLSVVAQTLRGPVSSLFSTAATLFPYLEELENTKIQPQTAALNRSFYQLLRLTGNLTDASRFFSGDILLFREPTELVAFFTRIYNQCAPLCQAAGIALQFTCPDRPQMGSIDRQKVERALLNLLSNAIKFTPSGGEIELHVEWTNSNVLIRVRDNGEGMTPDIVATAFNRYVYRDTLGDPRWGVGLGLPIVRHVAQLHGGTVIMSSRPQTGTCVTMSLALTPPSVKEKAENTVNSPILNFDYAGGFNHTLVELADAIPASAFDSVNVN